MSTTVITLESYREKLANRTLSGGAMPTLAQAAWGDGGHEADLSAKPIANGQSALNNELLRKNLASVVMEDNVSVTGTGVIDYEELIGYAISEVALIDNEGDIIGIKNFGPKVKEAEERYETQLRIRF